MNFNHNFHGHIPEQVRSEKYLGITLSADLKLNNQQMQIDIYINNQEKPKINSKMNRAGK